MFMTGATGFLGHYMLAGLLSGTEAKVRVLLRPHGDSERRLERLLADLGIDLHQFRMQGRVEITEGVLPYAFEASCLEGIDTVVHAAANTRFHADGTGEPAGTNVEGTRVLLDRAAECGVRHFVYISTAYVCGAQSGRIREAFTSPPSGFCNEYERSKWMGEKLVDQWRRPGRVATICRPAILFGDSHTGRTTALGGIYLIARATEILARAVADDPKADRREIPLRILGRHSATCNLVPVDWAAGRIVDILREPGRHGRIHHVTNPAPPTHAEIKHWLEEYFDIAGGRFSELPWPLPDANHYEDLFYSLGNIVRDYFRDGLVFESRHACVLPQPPRLVNRDLFIRSIRYAQSRNWGREPLRKGPALGPTSPVDPRSYFESFLPQSVPRSCVARVHSLTTVVRFIIDRPRREWVCRYESGRLAEVRRDGDGIREEFGFTVTSGAFADLVGGRRSLQSVFFSGEADIFGNVEKALRMVPVMAAFIEEFPFRDQ